MKTMIFRGALAATAAMAMFSSVHAAELQFDVVYGLIDLGVTETFDIDTSQVGTVSAAGVEKTDVGDDADFSITNDSLGNTLLQVGDSGDSNYFATATSDFAAYYTTPTYTSETSQQFFNGDNLLFHAAAGETAVGDDGTSIAITSAVSAAPEPSTWLLMIAAIGGVGLMLRRAKKTMGFRFRALSAPEP